MQKVKKNQWNKGQLQFWNDYIKYYSSAYLG